MASGGMDTTSVVSLVAFGLAFATFIIARIKRRREEPLCYDTPFDPFVPEEMRGNYMKHHAGSNRP